MAQDITFSTGYGGGGSGNPDDYMFINGSGWTAAETVAANSITVGGSATTHPAITVDSNGKFTNEPLYIKITEAITSAGYKDIIVTGSVSGAKTFSNYWYVTAGCGINDIFRVGDFDKQMASAFELEPFIDEARECYNGYMEGWLSTTYFPHTVGNYPKPVASVIACLAVSEFWKGRGGAKEYMERSKMFYDRAMKKLMMIKGRKIKLYDPATGVAIPVTAPFKLHDATVNNQSGTTDYNTDTTDSEYS